MKYPLKKEKINPKEFIIDGEHDESYKINKISSIISSFTGINEETLISNIKNFGISNVLNNPSIMCITKEQEDIIKELNLILLFGDGEKWNK